MSEKQSLWDLTNDSLPCDNIELENEWLNDASNLIEAWNKLFDTNLCGSEIIANLSEKVSWLSSSIATSLSTVLLAFSVSSCSGNVNPELTQNAVNNRSSNNKHPEFIYMHNPVSWLTESFALGEKQEMWQEWLDLYDALVSEFQSRIVEKEEHLEFYKALEAIHWIIDHIILSDWKLNRQLIEEDIVYISTEFPHIFDVYIMQSVYILYWYWDFTWARELFEERLYDNNFFKESSINFFFSFIVSHMNDIYMESWSTTSLMMDTRYINFYRLFSNEISQWVSILREFLEEENDIEWLRFLENYYELVKWL